MILEKLREGLNRLKADPPRGAFHAAVIVPLIRKKDEVDILFELRAAELRRSSAEVGFPGGMVEGDEDPFQAALRELEEEVGIGPQQVKCLGRMPDFERGRGEVITPFVCLLDGNLRFKVQENEVAEVFRVPLSYFLKCKFKTTDLIEEYTLSPDFPVHYLPGEKWYRRRVRPVYYLPYRNYLIWGLTAEILVMLLELLK